MKYFINYASKGFYNSQIEALNCAENFGFVTKAYNDLDIDQKFKEENKSVLESSRGAGYWLWKPYIILDMLNKINDGDYLIYMDSGAKLVGDPSSYLESIDEKGILAFSMVQKTSKWTKGDCFYFINGDNKNDFSSYNQLQGTYIFFRKCESSIRFVKKWLDLCTKDNLITDSQSKFMQNFPDFIDHRHDQAIFSLLCYNEVIQNVPQIDQYCIEHGLSIERKIVYRHGIRS